MQCPKPIYIDAQQLPCGHCYVCKTNLMSDWIIRLNHEATNCHQALFVTLTYATENLTVNDNDQPCLIKSDLQKWLKRLRKKNSVRYYAVGEYGTKRHRPHYHVLLFTYTPVSYSDLEKSWGLGIIHVGTLTPASTAYTLKYVYNRKKYQDKPSEFALMSRKPGLGAHKIPFLAKRNFIYLNGYKKRMPRYYKNKLMTKDERKQLTEQTLQAVAAQEAKELNRLKVLGYEHPELELHSRQVAHCELLEYRSKFNDYKRKF